MCNVQQIMYRIMIILDSFNLISTTLFVCKRLLHTFICGRGEERGNGFYFYFSQTVVLSGKKETLERDISPVLTIIDQSEEGNDCPVLHRLHNNKTIMVRQVIPGLSSLSAVDI